MSCGVRCIAYNYNIPAVQKIILMETPTESTNGKKLNEFVYNKYLENSLTDTDLVQLLVLLFDLLGLKSIAKFCKLYGKNYKGVQKFNKNVIDANGYKFVIDNE
jgi:hypothetical protein